MEQHQHLGYAKHDAAGKNTGNFRNGKNRKSVRTIHGDIQLETPRDCIGEPSAYKLGLADCEKFREIFLSAKKSIEESDFA